MLFPHKQKIEASICPKNMRELTPTEKQRLAELGAKFEREMFNPEREPKKKKKKK